MGASLRRKEDAFLPAGLGQFVADIRLPGMLDVAFVRSPVAHARLGAISKPEGRWASVFTMDELLVLHHGELIAQGLPQTVAAETKVIEAYRGTQYAVRMRA